jgi:hypothetical protein
LQENNGIPIKSWFDDKSDRELFMLLPVLRNLAEFYDVRTEIPKFVCNNTLLFKKAFKWVEDFYAITTNKMPSNSNHLQHEEQNFLKIKNSNYAVKNKQIDLTDNLGNNTENMTISYEEYCDPFSTPLDETFIIKNSNYKKEFSKKSQLNELNASENSFEYVEDIDLLGLDEPDETHDELNIKNSNSPKININIFNGNFNNIVLNTESNLNKNEGISMLKSNYLRSTKGESKLEVMTFSPQEGSYRVVHTEDNLNCKSPTQNIIAGLKNVSNNMNSKISQRKGLFYLKKKTSNNSNIKIVEDSLITNENSSELTKIDFMRSPNYTLKKKDSNLKTSLNKNFKKEKVKLDIYNIKTNYSSFLKGNKNQRSNKSNISASYMSNSLEKNNFTYDNLVLKTQENKTRNYKSEKIDLSSNKYNKSEAPFQDSKTLHKSLNNKSLVRNSLGTKSFASLAKHKTEETNLKEKNKLDEMKKIYTNKLMESFKKRSTLMSFVNKNLIQTEKKNDILIKANPSIPKVNVNSFLKSRIIESKNNYNLNNNQFPKFSEVLSQKNFIKEKISFIGKK